MIAPERAYIPPALEGGRAWGFGVNLYALRSQRNWGIGDFTDLRDFVRFAARAGADLVGVNPLHALHYVEPEAASPYSPTSRYFRNPIYIDVEAVPEFSVATAEAAAVRERIASPAFAAELAGLRDAPAVAYAGVARAKWFALAELYATFRDASGDRRARFREFVERGGERLERFAIHEALTEHFARDEGRVRGWKTWDAPYRDAGSAAVREWAAKFRRRVDYFKYLQWLADEQLAAGADEARALTIGLYLDVAVGVDVNSADVWSDPGAYVLDATVGAPPDPLGPYGQNWGLPPLAPDAMLRDAGATFAELLAANMRHAGALRLDHAMALLRLFWIPLGKTPADGTYVTYPLDALLAIARVQSAVARCAIVGEDLGNVPDGFRDRMEGEGILSYRLLLFEREADGSFKRPGAYPQLALATATTHDLPTLAGWALGRDITTRRQIGLTSAEAAEAALGARRIEVSRLLETLRDHGALDEASFALLHRAIDARSTDADTYGLLVRAAYRFLAETPARVVLVQLDDAALELDQVNLPGTFTEYPNWRRKSRLRLSDIARDDRIAALSAEVSARVKGGNSR
jgi:(1->4)-alpha-D-glucan 1-alpha-D-glucosylmutase